MRAILLQPEERSQEYGRQIGSQSLLYGLHCERTLTEICWSIIGIGGHLLLSDVQSALVQWFRLLVLALRRVEPRQRVEVRNHIGMLWSQCLLKDRQSALIQWFR